MKYLAGSVLLVLVILSVSYGGYQFKRWWNYKWGYAAQVQTTVCEMVKPEALINPERC